MISTTESKRTLTKKRKRIPENWQKNIRKTKREGGEEYVDIKRQLHPAKKVKEGCKPKCSHKCSDYFSNEERNQIMKQLYKLSDEKKLHLYSKYTIRGEPLRERTYKEKSRKSHVYKYYLEHNNTRVQVCKEFFCGILSISQQRIYYFHEKIQNPTTSVPRSPFKGRNVKKTYIK